MLYPSDSDVLLRGLSSDICRLCWISKDMDFLTSERRSRLMSRVRQHGTDIELLVRCQLRLRGVRFRRNVRALAGSPDLVFTKGKLAVFIDGDFWHGYRFPCWEHKLQ